MNQPTHIDIPYASRSNVSYLEEVWASRGGVLYQRAGNPRDPISKDELGQLKDKILNTKNVVASPMWDQVLTEINQEQLRDQHKYSGALWRQLLAGRCFSLKIENPLAKPMKV